MGFLQQLIIPNLVIITSKNYQVDSDDSNPLESNDCLFEDESKLESICILAKSTIVEDSITLSEIFLSISYGYKVVPVDVKGTYYS